MAPRQAVLLTPLEATYLSQLPFYKHSPFSTPLEATLTRPLGSVHSKRLTKMLSRLESTLTKNRGRGYRKSPVSPLPSNPPSVSPWPARRGGQSPFLSRLPYLLAYMLINSRCS